jgi:release factor glutamine methyltransferase
MQRTGSVSDPGALSAGSATEMTVRSVVGELTESLKLAGVSEARRTAHDIITGILDVPRSWGIRHADLTLDLAVTDAARHAMRLIAAGAPFAYAIGRAPFRHLTLQVDPRVLIPRPETEVLVEGILRRFRTTMANATDWGLAIDVGTGSGAIALSLATDGKFSRIVATDSSLDALVVARLNSAALAGAQKCPVEFRDGSLLAPVRDLRARLLVSNPPYIAFDEAATLPASVRNWEPPSALLSGSMGLAETAAIVHGGATVLEPGGVLALEVDERRASLVAEMVMTAGCYIDIGVGLDLTGRERFVFASRA